MKWIPKEGDVIRWSTTGSIYILTSTQSNDKFSVISMEYEWLIVQSGRYTEQEILQCSTFVGRMPNIRDILNETSKN